MKATICDDYDWEEGRRYIDEHSLDAPIGTAACSKGLFGTCCSVEAEEKIVLVPDYVDRHASIGIAPTGAHSTLLVTEGVNDAGLACCICDICVKDKGVTSGTASGKDRLNASMAVRFLLDSADSVSMAARMLSEKDIYCSGGECHLLLCDRTRSAAIEFIDDRMTVTYGSDILTSFYVSGFETEADLQGRTCGLEEFRALEKGLPQVESANSMASLMALAGCPRKAPVTRVSVYDLQSTAISVFIDGERSDFAI